MGKETAFIIWKRLWFGLALLHATILNTSAVDPYANQARLYSEFGHLYIVGADHSNITLKTKGGYINVNDQDLLFITQMAKKSSEFVQRFETSILPQLQGSSGVSNELLVARLRRLEAAMTGANSTGADLYQTTRRRLRILSIRVASLTRILRGLRILLIADECESSPCQNGGSCTDMFNGFHCQCTSGWQGALCEKDVNECDDFAGTDLGCKNGATCRNLKGSYACTCPPGWYGLHCTVRTYDCTVQSSSDLCGNGICVNQGGTGRGFVCICKEGWTINEADGTCSLDKNECAGPHKPCSHDPPVECHNTLGSFTCGNCPQGYVGNGYHCTDIDECEINNGGCSVRPTVDCINLRGSRKCGPCPPGFAGDGITCSRSGRCQINNGGCHQLATCHEVSALQYIVCHCPMDYSGTGVGPSGCTPFTSSSLCNSNPCHNGGSCIPLSTTQYRCLCSSSFTGETCDSELDACSSGPCLNGGTCRILSFGNHRKNFYQCSCPSGFTGRDCEIKQDGCIERMYGTSGNISFPLANLTASVGRYVTCAWTVTVPINKVINLTFTEMNLLSIKSGSTCLLNNVEVFDGKTSSANQIGHYCGPELPPPIVSTHPALFITAKLSSTRATMKFNWTAIDPHCGGEVNATVHGTLSSPGSPGRYPRNAHCVWKLTSSPGQRIQLTFFSMDIERHADCSFDYLEIRSGDSDTSPLLRKLCNSTLPPPLTTTGYTATIIFHSGFQIAYAPKEGVPGCGGVFTSPHGQFSPPTLSGGTEYQEALNCEWLIEIPYTERIKVQITSFSLEMSDGCIYDNLAIYDGPTKNSGLLGRWCGVTTIPTITSSANALLLVFNSDYTMNEGGFVVNYVAVCGGTWTTNEGTISSPYYPNHYPEDRTCTYSIELPLGYAIKIRFTDFDLEASEDCMYDKLQIFDGNNENSQRIGEYCGTGKPGEIISTHNYLFMTFTTDLTEHNRGFQAHYSSVEISCGGIMTGQTGSISSPKYPEQYPPNHNCNWVISTKPETVIRLTWLAFHVYKSYECQSDWVAIFDNNTVRSLAGQLGGKYCGNLLPPVMTSSSNLMSIVFHTDASDSEPGFTASYAAINSKDVCGGNYFTSAGQIISPNYPNGYSNNLDCRWVITVPNGQQIRLIPLNFSLEHERNCRNDFLEIRNGGHESAPLIDTFCGLAFKRPIISLTNQLYLRFVTDVDDSMPGFLLLWDGAKTGCGGTLTSSSGAIMSPNYPQPYGRNGECIWKISVSEGSTISLTFTDLDLEDHSSCSLDYLEIYDGANKRARRLQKLCSSQNLPLTLSSTGNNVFLRFRSDASRQGRGFHVKYDIVCNSKVSGYRGIIESPGFPNTENVPRDCTWTISAPRGNKVNISFSHFALEEISLVYQKQVNVDHFVNIYDGSISENNLIGTYDSEVVPPRLKSSETNEVLIHYKVGSDNYNALVTRSMFRLEWIVSGCGGIFKNQKHGEITSPNYPKPYPHETECQWYISVHPGNSIKIKIDDLQIEDSENCEYDALEIYGGPDNTSPKLASLCKRLNFESPSILTTSGNEAVILFKTDASNSGFGFHAVYDLVPSSCGGEFTSPSGSFHSHNYPQNYDGHDDCSFIIKVDPTHTVNLTFTDFDIDAIDAACTNGYVKVYDGDSDKAPLLNTLCGNKLPSSIFSSSNVLYIRHKTDGFAVAKGFFASYQTACGAILSTDGIGTISFAELNSTFSWNSDFNCTWIIKSKLPDSKIRIQFTMFDMQNFPGLVVWVNENRTTTGVLPGINILSGEGAEAPLFRHISSSRLPPPILVPFPVVTILLHKTSEAESNPIRFALDYSVLDTACGGLLTAEGGIIVSPGYPDDYPNNVECVWTILVAPGNKIQFSFKSFTLDDSESCNEDYVEIRLEKESGPLVGVHCGTTSPSTITANQTLWIKFRSNLLDTAAGFEAEFQLVTFNELEGFIGSIASPLYPLPFYSSITYSWRISVKNRHIIRFAFTDFYIESYYDSLETECYNSLIIYDGYDSSASILKTFCGLTKPEPFTTESNIAYIEMKHTYKGMATRFLLNWMQMEKVPPVATTVSFGSNCSTFVELNRGNVSSYPFTSPGFPNGYKNRLNCEWIFQAPIGDHIRILFQAINLEISSRCTADGITLYNGGIKNSPDKWIQERRVCEENDTAKVYPGTRLVKVVFTTDSSVNKSGFSARATAMCGGEINQPNGVIAEGPYSNCQWNITVKPGRTIKLTLEKFLVRGTPPCSKNYLILRDGGSSDSPLLTPGKSCGDTVFDIPETQSNRVFIQYNAEITEGFILRYEEKSIICGDTIFLSDSFKSAVIHSPNYPTIPPAHIECIWRIIAPSGESVHFEVNNRFDMTWTKGCKSEYLELRDGSTEFGHLIGRYCSETPSYITTDGNSLYVKYFTDTDVPKDGFNATVSIGKCGGTVYTNGGNGSLLSPGYPSPYEGDLNCTWKLVAPYQMVLLFNLSYSLGGRAGSCNESSQDTLTITENVQDGFALEGPEKMVFCSGSKIRSITSEINEVFFHFRSLKQPIHLTNRYFKIDYRETPRECGGQTELPSGIIMSPNYPTSYQGRIYCTWRIKVPQGRRITFRLIDLDLLDGNNRTRPQWVSFYNGFRFNRIKVMSGRQNNITIIESSGNQMMITYRSVYRNTHRGFIGNYTSDLPALCGGSFETDAKSGSLVIADSLLLKNTSFSCEWESSSPISEPTTITYSFEGELSTISHIQPECYYRGSRLMILNINSKLVGDFCGVTKPNKPYLISKPNDRTIIQATKTTWASEKDSIKFSLKWKVDACGGTMKVSSPVKIKSPGNDTYPSNVDCVWSLSATEGATLKVSFKTFDLGDDCQDDYLKIYNGPSSLSPVMSLRCGNIVPADLISQSSNIWIHFHSGAAKKKKGFSIEISEADTSCGGVLHLKLGQIQSPGYPSNYKNNIECDWEIQSPLGFHIGLTFIERFFIEENAGCTRDYIEISDFINNNWVPIKKLCGRNLQTKSYNSTSNRMRILFKSNANITGDGFKALFNWNCGGRIEVTSKGHLYSPGWPNVYGSNLSCNYTLVALKKTITLRTETFELESATPHGCYFDKVQFFTKIRHYFNLISNGIYCGKSTPPLQTSIGQMNITFKTDGYVNYNGFHFIYSISNCGGEITEETILSGSEIDPQNDGVTNCVWNVTAPANKIVYVKYIPDPSRGLSGFTSLDINIFPARLLRVSELSFIGSVSCNLEAISFYDTSNSSSNGTLLGKLCGVLDNTPVYFKSSGNKMQIKLASYNHQKNEALTIIVSFVYGPKSGCGGELSVEKSGLNIFNPDMNSDGSYESNMDCSWTISTNAGSTVLLSFETFNMEPCKGNFTNNTCCDYVEVYDGSSTNTHKIGKYCGKAVPRDISSSRNYMTVRFVSDEEGNSAGFRGRVVSHVSPCGPPVLNATATLQTLVSPLYPESYPINIHCEWLIVAARYVSVNVHIDSLDIEESSDCSADRLEVFDPTFVSWRFSNRFPLQKNIFVGTSIVNSRRPPIMRYMPVPVGHRFCGKPYPIDMYSSTNRLYVKFISDSQVTSKGFKLSYSIAGCSRNYTESQGRIHLSRLTNNCIMSIISPENSTISLYFLSIQMYKQSNGCLSKLEVYEGSNKTAEVCGYALPPPIFSKTNTLVMKTTSSTRMAYSMDISYTTTDQGQGCGGTFFNSKGAFTSPLYPGNYRNASYCCWVITVPQPNKVKIIFKEFDIGSKSTCSTDYLQLFDVNTESDTRELRTTYCGGDTPAEFIGTGESAAVCYKTSKHNSGIGWDAVFFSYSLSPTLPVVMTTN